MLLAVYYFYCGFILKEKKMDEDERENLNAVFLEDMVECAVCSNELPANFKGICPRCMVCVTCD